MAHTAVSMALAVVAVAVASAQNLATTVLLEDAVSATGARCLDGTPQRYWIQRAGSAANSTKWAVHMMGGGWCESLDSCYERAYGTNCYIGSSNPECFTHAPGDEIPGVNFSSTMDFHDIPSCLGARWCGGMMMNDSTTNPLTHDWNKVLIPYCDGGSFSGNNETVTQYVVNGSTFPLYFRGQRNLDAVISDLLASRGLASASHLILSGDSAGGLATLWHVDHWASRLPATRVVGVPDSGYFYVDPLCGGWPLGLQWVARQMNSTDGLNAACTAAQRAAGADPLLCAQPQVVAPHIASPLFIMNSRFDPALDSITCGEGGGNASNVNRMGAALLELVAATVLSRPGNGAFITSCHQHCGQWAQGQGGPFADFNVTMPDGTNAIAAVSQWWSAGGAAGAAAVGGAAAASMAAAAAAAGTLEQVAAQPAEAAANVQPRSLASGGAQPFVWVQPATYPCADCCYGGQS